MRNRSENSIHAIVTDPPYGVKEYELDEIERLRQENGGTGIWRLPPVLNGHQRSPLPRFTALTQKDLKVLDAYFKEFAIEAIRLLKPGGHMLIASNSFLAVRVFNSISSAGFEFRGQIIRLVRTLRGGDRPKNGEKEFPDVCSLPRGGFEPWGIFRKPIPNGMKVLECLRKYETGGLRRNSDGKPFSDVIEVGVTPQREKRIAGHPSQKPMLLMKTIVRAALPLGSGVILDPFMGSGTTIAAANLVGYDSIGIERDEEWFNLACKAIPKLAESDQGELFSR